MYISTPNDEAGNVFLGGSVDRVMGVFCPPAIQSIETSIIHDITTA